MKISFIDKRGYKIVKNEDSSWSPEHRKVFEKIQGCLSKDFIVHHINDDKLDNNINNLALMTRSAHATLHHRLRSLKECGDENFRKCFFCKKYDDPKLMITHHSGGVIHRECKAQYQREYRLEKDRR